MLAELVLVGRVVLVAVGVMAGRFVCVGAAVGGKAVGDATIMVGTGVAVFCRVGGRVVLVGAMEVGLAVGEGRGARGPLVN